MKANEAPEKIWIDNLDEGFWFDSPSGNKSIEYTRTDAFIEKAVKYVANHFLAPGMDNEIKGFVNYMKGE